MNGIIIKHIKNGNPELVAISKNIRKCRGNTVTPIKVNLKQSIDKDALIEKLKEEGIDKALINLSKVEKGMIKRFYGFVHRSHGTYEGNLDAVAAKYKSTPELAKLIIQRGLEKISSELI